MTEQMNQRILIVDDNRAIHDDFRKILTPLENADGLDAMESALFGDAKPKAIRETYEMDSAFQGQEALEMVVKFMQTGQRYSLAFVDMRMPPGWDGLETIEKIWQVDSDIQMVICTAYSDYSWEEINARFGSADRLLILKKPYDTIEVCQLASALTKKWHLARHAHLKLNQLKGMVNEQTQQLETTNQKLMQEIQQHRAAEDRYRLAETGANDGLWDWDLIGDRIYYSTRWKAMLGFADAQITDSPSEWIGRVHPDDRAGAEKLRSDHFSGVSDQFRAECRVLHRDGQYRWVLIRGVAQRDQAGRAIRAAGSFTDITERKMAEEQLRFEAMHDALTGLANRVKLSDRIGDALCRLKRDPAERFAVMFMDLDRFKVINDSLGHLVGDKFLVEIARRLSGFVRGGDTLARSCRDDVARIGGDEFVLLVQNIHHDSDVLHVADRLHTALSEPFVIDEHEICTGVSIGIAVAHENYGSVTEILRDADTALYQAKGSGRNCTRIFDPEMHDRAMTQWRTETELRQAIEKDQLVLHYQPVIAADGSLACMEALVRWRHPTRGLLAPDAFIPVAEESDLIVRLGRWVLRNACRQLKAWVDEHREHADLPVSVNMASKQFALPTFTEEITRILSEADISPRALRLEITETVAMRDAHATMQTLLRLNSMGVLIDVDDFGTGYSSLSYLHRMPVHALKIDRSFVGSMHDDSVSRSIVRAITILAHSLNVGVIAEGVETPELAQLCREIGCDFYQGYFLARPMDAQAAERFIAATRPYRSGSNTLRVVSPASQPNAA